MKELQAIVYGYWEDGKKTPADWPNPPVDGIWGKDTNKNFWSWTSDKLTILGRHDAGINGKPWRTGAAAASEVMKASYSPNVAGALEFVRALLGAKKSGDAEIITPPGENLKPGTKVTVKGSKGEGKYKIKMTEKGGDLIINPKSSLSGSDFSSKFKQSLAKSGFKKDYKDHDFGRVIIHGGKDIIDEDGLISKEAFTGKSMTVKWGTELGKGTNVGGPADKGKVWQALLDAGVLAKV